MSLLDLKVFAIIKRQIIIEFKCNCVNFKNGSRLLAFFSTMNVNFLNYWAIYSIRQNDNKNCFISYTVKLYSVHNMQLLFSLPCLILVAFLIE